MVFCGVLEGKRLLGGDLFAESDGMTSLRFGWGWLLLSLFFAATCSARERWIYARTAHFEMYSSDNESDSRDLLNDLEQFRTAFRTAFQLPLTGEAPVTVVVFGSAKQFEPFQPLYRGKPKEVAGYCAGRPTGTYIAMATSYGWEYARKTIFHEYVHRMVQEGGLRLPAWLNEGLATVYATAEITPELFKIGQPDVRYLQLIRREREMPLDRLIAVTQASPEYNESDQINIFYATSWALTHYLLCGVNGDNKGKMARFAEQLSEPGANPVEAFKTAFNADLGQLQKQLSQYLQAGEYLVRSAKIASPDLKKTIHFEPANEVAKQVALEYLRYGRSAHDPGAGGVKLNRSGIGGALDSEVLQRLQALTLQAPAAPEPYAALGAISFAYDNNLNQAKYDWRKAVELGSQDPFVYFQLAECELRDVLRGLTLDYRMPPAVADSIRADLMKAIQFRPDYYDAWEALALLEAVSKQMNKENLARIQTLATKEHSTPRTLIALAIVRWRIRDYATCHRILDMLGSDTRDKWVGSMRRKLMTRLAKDESSPPSDSPESAATPAAAGGS